MNDFPWDRFFHNFFSHSLVFCFSEMALSWELIFFFWILLVLSIDVIWLRDFNVRVYVGLWMPDVDFAFYVFFFKITALDSVWFLDNLLLSDYLSVRGEVPNLTGHWFHFILFSQPWEFQRNSFFLFLFFSSSAKLSRDFHSPRFTQIHAYSRIFTQIEFFWLKFFLIMNFCVFILIVVASGVSDKHRFVPKRLLCHWFWFIATYCLIRS